MVISKVHLASAGVVGLKFLDLLLDHLKSLAYCYVSAFCFIFGHVATQSDCNRGPPLKGETLRLEQISDQSKLYSI